MNYYEQIELDRYILSDGMKLSDLIKSLEESADERMEKQGYHK